VNKRRALNASRERKKAIFKIQAQIPISLKAYPPSPANSGGKKVVHT
jgi:hypothetical protein